jgi:predicted DNA-binding ribbon-helix-helix protein
MKSRLARLGMTLGNMRALGVQRLTATCFNDACRHTALIDVSGYPAETEVASFAGILCSKCGGKRMSVRPNWRDRPERKAFPASGIKASLAVAAQSDIKRRLSGAEVQRYRETKADKLVRCAQLLVGCPSARHKSSPMPQPTENRVVRIQIRKGGRRIGLAIERPFWAALKDIAVGQGTSMSRLVAKIDSESQNANRSSAVRLFVLDYYRDRAEFTGAAQAQRA